MLLPFHFGSISSGSAPRAEVTSGNRQVNKKESRSLVFLWAVKLTFAFPEPLACFFAWWVLGRLVTEFSSPRQHPENLKEWPVVRPVAGASCVDVRCCPSITFTPYFHHPLLPLLVLT